jgi:hypothetical protein
LEGCNFEKKTDRYKNGILARGEEIKNKERQQTGKKENINYTIKRGIFGAQE